MSRNRAGWTLAAAGVVGLMVATGVQTAAAAPNRPSVVTAAEFDAHVAAESARDKAQNDAIAALTARVAQFESTPAPTPTPIAALTADSGRPFAADGPWNTALPANPALDPNSAAMIGTTAAKGATANVYAYGAPVYTASASDPLATVDCTENWGTCKPERTGVRLPAAAQPSSGSDAGFILVDLVAQKSCDFWQAVRSGNSIRASWATCVPLADKDGVGPQGGATGGNINGLAGIVRTFEVRSGSIPHALAFATGNSCPTFRYPATKSDGNGGTNCMPEGARVQLDPSIDVDTIPGITPIEKMTARALQTYGGYNRDNCGANFCLGFESPQGETDPYKTAGLPWDYWNMPHIPWDKMRVINQSVTLP